jgi:hypothetical protein
MVVDCGSLDCRLGLQACHRPRWRRRRKVRDVLLPQLRCAEGCGGRRIRTVRLVRIRPNFSTISYVLPCLQAKLGCQHDVEKEADDGPAMDGAGVGRRLDAARP